jgi:flagellar motor switch protein FliN
MSDNDQLSQNEIDALLSGGGAPPPPPPPKKAAPAAPAAPAAAASQGEDALMGQADIDALLNQITSGAPAAAAASATATATATMTAPAPSVTLPEAIVAAASVTIEPLSVAKVDLLKDVSVKVRVELGRGKMYLRDIIRLTHGSVVELEKLAGDPLDIYVNERLIAKGEVLVLNENFCVRITEIFSPDEVLRLKN